MTYKRDKTICTVKDCNAPRYTTEFGTTHTLCEKHQREYWNAHQTKDKAYKARRKARIKSTMRALKDTDLYMLTCGERSIVWVGLSGNQTERDSVLATLKQAGYGVMEVVP